MWFDGAVAHTNQVALRRTIIAGIHSNWSPSLQLWNTNSPDSLIATARPPLSHSRGCTVCSPFVAVVVAYMMGWGESAAGMVGILSS